MSPAESCKNTDMAGQSHWDEMYGKRTLSRQPWQPIDYRARSLCSALLGAVNMYRPNDIMEIGCGDSCWLPFLAKQANIARVIGIDYSAIGCDMARQRLADDRIDGEIYNVDVFGDMASKVPQCDFVYSLGLVEHFPKLEETITTLLRFVRPGGFIFTSIPNLRSIHGFLSQTFHPRVYAKHIPYSSSDLQGAYRNLTLEDVRGGLLGMASLSLISLQSERRFVRIPKFLLPPIQLGVKALDQLFCITHIYRGIPGLAPYAFAIGKKPETPGDASTAGQDLQISGTKVAIGKDAG